MATTKQADPISSEWDLCHFICMYGWISIGALALHFHVTHEAMKKRMQRVLVRIKRKGVDVQERKVLVDYKQEHENKTRKTESKEWMIWDCQWRRFYEE